MYMVKNIELLPQFFEDTRKLYGNEKLSDGKLIVALMSDLLPGETELRRCVKLAYESNAMACVIEISENFSEFQVCKNKAVDRLCSYSFMEKSVAEEIINAIIFACYPDIEDAVRTPEEQIEMGSKYLSQKNYLRAVACFSSAAEKGNAEAQRKLGWCCEEGKGVEKDLSRAVYWYGKAAEQGDGGAMYKLGWCFLNGVGVQRDKGRAAYYYNKAARQGNLLAKIALEALV